MSMLNKLIPGFMAVLVASSVGFAQSAYGIKLPVRGAPEVIPSADDLKQPVLDESTGIDRVEGASIDFAASGAARQAAKPEPAKGQSKYRRIEGAAFFEDHEGNVGLMVTGVGRYSSDFPNPDLVRIARRSAYVAAHADAMQALTEKLYGATIEQKVAVLAKLKVEVGELTTRSAATSSLDEVVNEKMSGLIRGVQVWKCQDEGGSVRVWLFLTREAAAACRAVGTECKVTTLSSYQEAIDSVLDECTRSLGHGIPLKP